MTADMNEPNVSPGQSPSVKGLEDLVQPFQVDKLGVMGRLVRLDKTVVSAVAGHDYPPDVENLVAETAVLAVTLASVLKYDGVFSLQAQGNGPVGLVMADVTSNGHVRAYARVDAERLATADPALDTVPRLLGSGHLAFTVDQGPDTDRYQGITALEGATLSDVAHTYFRQSEQLDTAILVASTRDPLSAGALMIQKLPEPGPQMVEPEDETWHRAVVLMSSLGRQELLDETVSMSQLLYRLYHEDDVRVFASRGVSHVCRCSQERVENTLKSFPRDEINDMAVDGVVTVTCEFCKTDYVLGQAELDRLFGVG